MRKPYRSSMGGQTPYPWTEFVRGVMKQKLKVCWISAGISSFMGGYLAGDVDEWIYIDISDQHEDSMRFIHDCEKAIGKEIQILKSSQYTCVEDCVRAFGGFRNYRNGFAPCTNWLKKRIRKQWEEEHRGYELIYVWGFDLKERDRADRTVTENPQAEHEFPLIEKNLSKRDVHGLFERMFSFPRPQMYEMGYPNNNCVGCVKGGFGYWNRIRVDFPETFQQRAALEREIGHSMLKDYKGNPVYLDELEPDRGDMNTEVFPECSIMCHLVTVSDKTKSE